MDYLLVPQDIAMSIIKATIGFENIVFVGGIADYMNLKDIIDLPINDIDFVCNSSINISNLYEYYNVVEQNINFDYKQIVPSVTRYRSVDIDLIKTSVRIDIFERNLNELSSIKQGNFYGYNINYASYKDMIDIHYKSLHMYNKYGNKKRLLKHSKKLSYYKMLNLNKQK